MRRTLSMMLVFLITIYTAPLSVVAIAQGVVPDGGAGSISSVVQTPDGEPLPGLTVRIRNLSTGEAVASGPSGADGKFTAGGLAPGDYVVEVLNGAGDVVGTSAKLVVTAKVVTAVSVVIGSGSDKALILALLAAGAGVTIFFIVKSAEDEDPPLPPASPSS